MPVLRADTAPVFHLAYLSVTGCAAPSRGSQELSVWRVTLAPGAPGLAHTLDREEVFVVLGGTGLAELNGDRIELQTGDTLIVPAGERFALSNPGAAPFEAFAFASAGIQARVDGADAFVPPWAV